MRLVLSLVAIVALAGYRGGCDPTPYDPCADTVCGSPCRACDPGDAKCVETAVVKACDLLGACVASLPELCGVPEPVPGACDGKACGESCSLEPPCRNAEPPCLAPTVMGACSADGVCSTSVPECPPPPPAPPTPPYYPCAGKTCGDTCTLCPPDATSCLEPMYLKACDLSGACVAAPVTCEISPPPTPPPYDPCSGKICGDTCDMCAPGEPCPMIAVMTFCDRSGACVPGTPVCYDPCAGKACHGSCQVCAPGDAGCMEPMMMKWCDGAGACVAEGTGATCP